MYFEEALCHLHILRPFEFVRFITCFLPLLVKSYFLLFELPMFEVRGVDDKFPDFFRMGTFIESTHMKLEVISSGCNELVVPFKQFLVDPMEVLLCERVHDLRHSLFQIINSLITTAFELREKPKVTGSKVWTIGRLRNYLDAHLGQMVCDKDGVVDWSIVQVEMPLT